jgi:hypothetical protein
MINMEMFNLQTANPDFPASPEAPEVYVRTAKLQVPMANLAQRLQNCFSGFSAINGNFPLYEHK